MTFCARSANSRQKSGTSCATKRCLGSDATPARRELEAAPVHRAARQRALLPDIAGWRHFPNINPAPKCPTQMSQSAADGMHHKQARSRHVVIGSLSRQGGRAQSQVSKRRQCNQQGGVRGARPKLCPAGSPRRKPSTGSQAKGLGSFCQRDRLVLPVRTFDFMVRARDIFHHKTLHALQSSGERTTVPAVRSCIIRFPFHRPVKQ